MKKKFFKTAATALFAIALFANASSFAGETTLMDENMEAIASATNTAWVGKCALVATTPCYYNTITHTYIDGYYIGGDDPFGN